MTATTARTRTVLTEVDLIRIEHLVRDHAGTYYGGPLQLGVSDAIRYTSEAHVEKEFPDVAYDTLWAAIRAVLNADISILDRRLTDADRKAAEAARSARAHDWLGHAGRALEALDFALAAAYVDQAEREHPEAGPGFYGRCRELICVTAAVRVGGR